MPLKFLQHGLLTSNRLCNVTAVAPIKLVMSLVNHGCGSLVFKYLRLCMFPSGPSNRRKMIIS